MSIGSAPPISGEGESAKVGDDAGSTANALEININFL